MRQICPRCNASGWVYVKRRGEKGKTVESQEVCPTCDGSGWVDSTSR